MMGSNFACEIFASRSAHRTAEALAMNKTMDKY